MLCGWGCPRYSLLWPYLSAHQQRTAQHTGLCFLSGLFNLPHYYHHQAIPKPKRTFVFQSPLQNQTIITDILETGELIHRQITAKNLQCWPLILATTVASYIQNSSWPLLKCCEGASHSESTVKAEREERISTTHYNVLSTASCIHLLACIKRLRENCMPFLKPPVTSGQDSWSGEHQETSHQCKPSGWVTQEHKDKCQKDQLILGSSVKTPIAHV